MHALPTARTTRPPDRAAAAGNKFGLSDCPVGWAECTVADQNANVLVHASAVTAGPECLLRAVTQLVQGADQARAEFEAKPAANRWIFRRDGTMIRIRLLRLADRGNPDDAGVLIWTSGHSVIAQLTCASAQAGAWLSADFAAFPVRSIWFPRWPGVRVGHAEGVGSYGAVVGGGVESAVALLDRATADHGGDQFAGEYLRGGS